MTAAIVMNNGGGPVVGSLESAAALLVTLSNQNNTGVLGWEWELTDKPEGSGSVLSSTTSATPTITPDIPGTYMARLKTFKDAARTILDDADFQALRVRYPSPFDWALPGAGETKQFDPLLGWKKETNAILDDIRTALIAADAGIDAASEVLWKWDGVGVSQFGTPIAYVTGAGAHAVPTMSFVAADATKRFARARCRMVGGEGGGGGGQTQKVFIPINDLPTLPDRYVIEMWIENLGAGGIQQAGYEFASDGGAAGAHWALALLHQRTTNNLIYMRSDGNAFPGLPAGGSTAGVISALNANGTFVSIEVVKRINAAAGPGWLLNIRCTAGSGAGSEGALILRDDFLAETYPAGWNNKALTKAGLALWMDASGTTLTDQDYEWSMLRILKHPMDR